jgi:hypothetical protein
MRTLSNPLNALWPCSCLVALFMVLGPGIGGPVISRRDAPAWPNPAAQAIAGEKGKASMEMVRMTAARDCTDTRPGPVGDPGGHAGCLAEPGLGSPADAEIPLMIEAFSDSGNSAGLRFFPAERGFFDRLNPADLQIHFSQGTTAKRVARNMAPVFFSAAGKEGLRFKF